MAAETCNEWLLADAGVNEDDDILIELYQKGWLQFDPSQESYSMHPVFAQFIYEKVKPSAEMHPVLMEECQKRLKIPEYGSALECQKFIPFAENMIVKLGIGRDIKQVRFIFDTAYLLYYVAEYEKAGKLYEKSLRISERVLGEEHPDTAASYNNLAGVYLRQGVSKKMLAYYLKAFKVFCSQLGLEHPNTQTVYNNIKMVYDKLNPKGNFKHWLEEKVKE